MFIILFSVWAGNKLILLGIGYTKYQPSGEGGARYPPATPAKSKMAARGPKMADGVWKGVFLPEHAFLKKRS